MSMYSSEPIARHLKNCYKKHKDKYTISGIAKDQKPQIIFREEHYGNQGTDIKRENLSGH